jgi:dolichol-phosphate mannosyltransferase
MEIKKDEVCILIPTLNEAPTIGGLIQSFRKKGYNHILIIDGHSTDATEEIAKREGAVFVTQTTRGKGNAIIEAIQQITSPCILMLDGDGTYTPDNAETMLTPLFNGYDHVIGDRLTGSDASLSRFNRIGNRLINSLFKLSHGQYLSDILSGYRAFTLTSIQQMHLRESGFEIETEMAVQAVKNDHHIMVVPVSYGRRTGTDTKLRPVQDGFRIVRTMYRLAKTNNPLFYFGLIGVIISIFGIIVGFGVVVFISMEGGQDRFKKKDGQRGCKESACLK